DPTHRSLGARRLGDKRGELPGGFFLVREDHAEVALDLALVVLHQADVAGVAGNKVEIERHFTGSKDRTDDILEPVFGVMTGRVLGVHAVSGATDVGDLRDSRELFGSGSITPQKLRPKRRNGKLSHGASS